MLPFDTARQKRYVPPCIPTQAPKPPAGPGGVHEIKHDGRRSLIHQTNCR